MAAREAASTSGPRAGQRSASTPTTPPRSARSTPSAADSAPSDRSSASKGSPPGPRRPKVARALALRVVTRALITVVTRLATAGRASPQATSAAADSDTGADSDTTAPGPQPTESDSGDVPDDARRVVDNDYKGNDTQKTKRKPKNKAAVLRPLAPARGSPRRSTDASALLEPGSRSPASLDSITGRSRRQPLYEPVNRHGDGTRCGSGRRSRGWPPGSDARNKDSKGAAATPSDLAEQGRRRDSFNRNMARATKAAAAAGRAAARRYAAEARALGKPVSPTKDGRPPPELASPAGLGGSLYPGRIRPPRKKWISPFVANSLPVREPRPTPAPGQYQTAEQLSYMGGSRNAQSGVRMPARATIGAATRWSAQRVLSPAMPASIDANVWQDQVPGPGSVPGLGRSALGVQPTSTFRSEPAVHFSTAASTRHLPVPKYEHADVGAFHGSFADDLDVRAAEDEYHSTVQTVTTAANKGAHKAKRRRNKRESADAGRSGGESERRGEGTTASAGAAAAPARKSGAGPGAKRLPPPSPMSASADAQGLDNTGKAPGTGTGSAASGGNKRKRRKKRGPRHSHAGSDTGGSADDDTDSMLDIKAEQDRISLALSAFESTSSLISTGSFRKDRPGALPADDTLGPISAAHANRKLNILTSKRDRQRSKRGRQRRVSAERRSREAAVAALDAEANDEKGSKSTVSPAGTSTGERPQSTGKAAGTTQGKGGTSPSLRLARGEKEGPGAVSGYADADVAGATSRRTVRKRRVGSHTVPVTHPAALKGRRGVTQSQLRSPGPGDYTPASSFHGIAQVGFSAQPRSFSHAKRTPSDLAEQWSTLPLRTGTDERVSAADYGPTDSDAMGAPKVKSAHANAPQLSFPRAPSFRFPASSSVARAHSASRLTLGNSFSTTVDDHRDVTTIGEGRDAWDGVVDSESGGRAAASSRGGGGDGGGGGGGVGRPRSAPGVRRHRKVSMDPHGHADDGKAADNGATTAPTGDGSAKSDPARADKSDPARATVRSERRQRRPHSAAAASTRSWTRRRRRKHDVVGGGGAVTVVDGEGLDPLGESADPGGGGGIMSTGTTLAAPYSSLGRQVQSRYTTGPGAVPFSSVPREASQIVMRPATPSTFRFHKELAALPVGPGSHDASSAHEAAGAHSPAVAFSGTRRFGPLT